MKLRCWTVADVCAKGALDHLTWCCAALLWLLELLSDLIHLVWTRLADASRGEKFGRWSTGKSVEVIRNCMW